MAYYKNGNKELARRELEAALNMDQKFDEMEEAKKVIARLRR